MQCKLRSDFVDLREDYNITLVLRGLRRIKGDTSEPIDPILPEDLKKMEKQIQKHILEEYVVWMIVLLTFRTLLRKSHFVVDRDEIHLLRVRDVKFHTWGCTVEIFSSKTIQFKERMYRIPVYYINSSLCVVTLLKNYLSNYPKKEDYYLFSLPNGDTHTPIRYDNALKLLKKWSISAGIAKKVGFHSLCRASATFMHKLNISLTSIQQAGDWQSLCVLKYLSCDFEDKLNIERLVSSSL